MTDISNSMNPSDFPRSHPRHQRSIHPHELISDNQWRQFPAHPPSRTHHQFTLSHLKIRPTKTRRRSIGREKTNSPCLRTQQTRVEFKLVNYHLIHRFSRVIPLQIMNYYESRHVYSLASRIASINILIGPLRLRLRCLLIFAGCVA